MYRSLIKRRWEADYKPANTNEPETPSLTTIDIFERHMSKRVRVETRDELQIYLSEKPVQSALLKGTGPLTWWKARETDFPNLSKMARDYLAVAGTGVSIERFFSLGKLLLSDNRQLMHEDTIQQCLSLKIWLKSSNNSDLVTEISNSILDKIEL